MCFYCLMNSYSTGQRYLSPRPRDPTDSKQVRLAADTNLNFSSKVTQTVTSHITLASMSL